MTSYLAIIFLLFCSAFFSSSEIAYASANKTRLKRGAENGSMSEKWALEISENYDKALCSILIGNNLVNIASSSVATVIAMHLMGDAGAAVATAVMTVLLLIFGEIVPKQLAKQFCDGYAVTVAPMLRVFMAVTSPLVRMFMVIIKRMSRLWGGSDKKEITYEDLATIIETVEEEGVIDEDVSELLQSAIEFDETEVREIITHRVDMLALNINDDVETLVKTAVESEYSRIPVYDKSIDDVVGILQVNHLLKELMDHPVTDLKGLLTPVVFVPHTKKLPDVLEQLRRQKNHMAVVTDDYGGTYGVITMEDILEELVGEIWDETDEVEPEITNETENGFVMDGNMMLGDFLDYIEMEDEELEDDIITVNGWVTQVLGDYPKTGQYFSYKNYLITVLETEEFCATKIGVERNIPEEEQQEEQ